MILKRLAIVAAALALPLAARAAGGHDSVGCGGCHSIHTAKGDIIFAVAPNKTLINPKTKQPYTGTTALCLGCHAETKDGGQGYAPVSANHSHPYGMPTVNPKVARVPSELLRDGGKFECLGCHDPHPSNPYYKYLRVDTKGGQEMDAFCAVCHAMKTDATVAANVRFFTSMDETATRAAAAAAPAAKKEPAAAPAKPATTTKKK